uniref:Putative ovule protein n=1 Tax=Solanum chacoense TaxID=4108 RepID=A0A0V0GWC4_SOLCH
MTKKHLLIMINCNRNNQIKNQKNGFFIRRVLLSELVNIKLNTKKTPINKADKDKKVETPNTVDLKNSNKQRSRLNPRILRRGSLQNLH